MPAVLLMSVLAVLVGCGSSGPEPSRLEQGQPAAAGPVLPFDAYRLTESDRATVNAAETALTRECMERKGFTWIQPDTAVVAEPAVRTDGNARRYGLIDEHTAQRYGYHVPDEPEAVRAQARRAAWLTGLTSKEQEALFGDGGCAAGAASRLRGGAGDLDDGWFVSLDFATVDRSAEDPLVVRTVASWSRCMGEQGFEYSSPPEAIRDPQWNLDSTEISPRELAVATADVRCKQRTDLVAIRSAAETRIQDDLIAQNAGRFAKLAGKLEQAHLRVDEALALLESQTHFVVGP